VTPGSRTSPETHVYSETPNKAITAANGVTYAKREIGTGPTLLALPQHSGGNLDNCDAALVDGDATANGSTTTKTRPCDRRLGLL
jgi:hypothetical protein